MLIKNYSPDSRKILSKIYLDHIKPNFKVLLIALLGMLIAAASTGALTFIIQRVIDDVIVNLNFDMLVSIAVIAMFISIMKGLGDFIKDIALAKLGQSMVTKFQMRGFDTLIAGDLELFHKNKTGDLVFHLTNDVLVLRNMVTTSLTNIGKDLATLIFLIILAFYKDWKLALVGFVGFPLILMPILQISFKVRRFANKSQSEMGAWSTFLIQSFQGIRLIKSYNLENMESTRARDILNSIQEIIIKSAKTKALIHPIMETLIGIATAGVIFIGGMYVISGEQSAGTLLSFVGALLLAYRPIKNLTQLNNNVQESLISARRLYSLLDIKPSIVDVKGAKTLSRGKGRVSFLNVDFDYPNGTPALHDITFDVQSGEKIAIVGASGAGKSSLINLIPRFYDCKKGKILIDNVDISQVTLNSLRNNIALVSQENILFNDTIYTNIAYGREGCSFEDVKKAAKMAAALEFVEDLPFGFETMVGENGVSLSGGQRQRIAIARALIKDAPILLLDEATSALDSEAENQVQSGIAHLMEGRTTLVVAHRLSTIVDADNILVLNKGRLVESGKHQDLIKLNGFYARLYDAQNFLDKGD